MKINRTLYFITILLLSFLKIPAQNDIDQEKNSLRKQISETEGYEKLKLYSSLSRLYASTVIDDQKMDTLLALFDEMYEEAGKQGEIGEQGIILVNTIITFKNRGMFDEVIRRAPDCINFLAENELWDYYYQAVRLLIDSYLSKGEYDPAIIEAEKLYKLAKERKDEGGLAIALYSIANTYNNQSRFGDMEKYLRECIELINTSSCKNCYLNIRANSYALLCTSLRNQGRYEEAIKILPEYENAIHNYEETFGIAQPAAWSNFFTVVMHIYLATEQYDKAEYYCDKVENTVGTQIEQYEVLKAKAIILASRKQYSEALSNIDKTRILIGGQNKIELNQVRKIKMEILIKMGEAKEAMLLFEEIIDTKDSIYSLEVNAKFDELRTQYEVDKHITEKELNRIEKERNRNYFLFALSGCILFIILLIIWIRYSRIVTKKNRGLVSQIKEIQIQQQQHENELFYKITFETGEKENDGGFHSGSRRDKLCIAIRDLILKDKIYHEPSINRNYMIDKLGISRTIFDDAVQHCFGMPFPEYINHLRMKDALKLLEESDLPIEIITEKVGYGSVRTFQRQFRNKYNMTPKEYRKLSKEKLI